MGGCRGDHTTEVKFPKNARKVNLKKNSPGVKRRALHCIEIHSLVSKISSRQRASNLNAQKVVLRMSFAHFIMRFRRSDWLFSFLLVLWGVLVVWAIRGYNTAYQIGWFKNFFIHIGWIFVIDHDHLSFRFASKGAWDKSHSRPSALKSDPSYASLIVKVEKFIWMLRHREICICERFFKDGWGWKGL